MSILLVVAAALAQPALDFNGTWVLKVGDQSVLKLTLFSKNGNITGSLMQPRQLSIDQDGDVTAIGGEQVSLPIQKAARNQEKLELTIDGDRFIFTLDGENRASLATEGMRPWRLERVADGDHVTLATSLKQPDYSPEIRSLREQLRAMIAEDQDARLAFDQARAAAADEKNRLESLRIFDRYGWVTNALAGKDAAHNYWLLIQHQAPEIQRRLLPALEKAAKDGNASMSDYAYLYDRVQIGLGKPQHWGSQAKCEKGQPALYPVDDPAGLDARRRELLMPPVREYLERDYLVKSCAEQSK